MSDRIKELKVQAYDLLGAIEHLQRNLQATNQEIAQLSQAEKDTPKSVEKPKKAI